MAPQIHTSKRKQPFDKLADGVKKKTKAFFLPEDEPTEARFRDSFGEQFSDLGKKKRWGIRGPASQIWNEKLLPLLEQTLSQNERRIFNGSNIWNVDILQRCYMMGSDESHAHPTLVIACNGRGYKHIIGRTMKLISKDEDFISFGFKIIGLRTPDLSLSGGSEIEDPDGDNLLLGPVSLCGKEIMSKTTNAKASIGGTIIVDGKYYALTVAHPFSPKHYHEDIEEEDEPSVEIFTTDWALDTIDFDRTDSEEHNLMDTAENFPTTMTKSSLSSSDTSSVSVDELTVSYDGGSQEAQLISQFNERKEGYKSDWALVKLEDPRYFGGSEIERRQRGGIKEFLYPESFSRGATQARVLVGSHGNLVEAIGESSLCLVKLRGSQTYERMWSIHAEALVAPGSSGSWAIDYYTHEVYGSVLASSGVLNEVILMPIDKTANEICHRLSASNITLPTRVHSLWISLHYHNSQAFSRILNTNNSNCNEKVPKSLENLFGQGQAQEATLLHWATMMNNLEILEILLASGASLISTTEGGEIPLHWAVKKPDSSREQTRNKIIRLLTRGTDKTVNFRDKSGRTPLLLAVSKGYTSAVDIMLKETNADVHCEDHKGNSPIKLAELQGPQEILKRLLDHIWSKTSQQVIDVAPEKLEPLNPPLPLPSASSSTTEGRTRSRGSRSVSTMSTGITEATKAQFGPLPATDSSGKADNRYSFGNRGFDIFDWHPAYESCQRYFLDHAQHDSSVQAVAALVNIYLPFQKPNPIFSASVPSRLPAGPGTDRELRTQHASRPGPPTFVSLVPYVARLVVTGFDKDGILHGFFGDNWRLGISHVRECERRNFLLAGKSVGWAKVKDQYAISPSETVPFMKPLQNVQLEEIESAEESWSDWLAMEDWMVGPRAPEKL